MYLTSRQLAARWQVSEKTLERWRHQGTAPAFLKVGNRVLYPTAQVEALEAARLRTATPLSLAGSEPGPDGPR